MGGEIMYLVCSKCKYNFSEWEDKHYNGLCQGCYEAANMRMFLGFSIVLLIIVLSIGAYVGRNNSAKRDARHVRINTCIDKQLELDDDISNAKELCEYIEYRNKKR